MATYAFAGGVAAVPSYGLRDKVLFGGTWAINELWSLAGVSSITGNFTIGQGNITALTPTVLMTFGNREYLGAGSVFAFSDNNDPTAWEEQAPGAGQITYLSQYGSQDTVNAFEIFQGRLAVFGRYSIQIWITNADPAQFSVQQVLTNIGTQAPLSVQGWGELDVFFLDDTGVRSLRVRDSSLNAFAVDVGSPVDIPIQAAIQGGALPSTACGVVEPASKRYWLFLEDTIYVLSYYPQLKITAWSTYLPSTQNSVSPQTIVNTIGGEELDVYIGQTSDKSQADQFVHLGGEANINLPSKFIWVDFHVPDGPVVPFIVAQELPDGFAGRILIGDVLTFLPNYTTFTPVKFVVFQGQVYVLDDNENVYVYGGTDNNTYDTTIATIESPYMDARQPQNSKVGERVNIAISGAWQIETGKDPRGAIPTSIVVPFPVPLPTTPDTAANSTFGDGSFSESVKGTHFKFKAYTSSNYAGPAILSSTTEQFNRGDEQ